MTTNTTITSIAETSVWGGWAIDRATALELAAAYHRHQPRVVFEAGSGYSTVIAAEYAARSGATVVSLDHDPHWARTTSGYLRSHGLEGCVDLRHAPLKTVDIPGGDTAYWYDTTLPDAIDFALIDGPPGSVGRVASMYQIHPHLNPDGRWHVWLDDSDRPGEQECLTRWSEDLPGLTVRNVALPRGLSVIRARQQARTDASDLIITILTGARPELLTQTVQSFQHIAPGVLDSAYVIVCHNGRDETTMICIEMMPFIDELVTVGGPDMIPMGDAMGALAFAVRDHGRKNPDRQMWMHLEDDWTAATTTPGWEWIETSRRLLRTRPDIGQVRLRHRCEITKNAHLLTRAPITWSPIPNDPSGALVAAAHWTANPSITRVADAASVWPAGGEGEAIQRFAETGALVAQINPGVFHHAGGQQSLEGHTVRPRRSPLRGRRTRGTSNNPVVFYEDFYRRGRGWAYNLGVEAHHLREVVCRLAGWTTPTRIVEIGAGLCDHAELLRSMGHTVTAVELSTAGATAATARYPNLDIVCADAAAWSPEQPGISVFARGMSWYHRELTGVSTIGVDTSAETQRIFDEWMTPGDVFVLQIVTNLSGSRPREGIHQNTVDDYRNLFEPLGSTTIVDWAGRPIHPGLHHDRGVVVACVKS